MADEDTLTHVVGLDRFKKIKEENLIAVSGGGTFLALGVPLVIAYSTGYAVGYFTNRRKLRR